MWLLKISSHVFWIIKMLFPKFVLRYLRFAFFIRTQTRLLGAYVCKISCYFYDGAEIISVHKHVKLFSHAKNANLLQIIQHTLLLIRLHSNQVAVQVASWFMTLRNLNWNDALLGHLFCEIRFLWSWKTFQMKMALQYKMMYFRFMDCKNVLLRS